MTVASSPTATPTTRSTPCSTRSSARPTRRLATSEIGQLQDIVAERRPAHPVVERPERRRGQHADVGRRGDPRPDVHLPLLDDQQERLSRAIRTGVGPRPRCGAPLACRRPSERRPVEPDPGEPLDELASSGSLPRYILIRLLLVIPMMLGPADRWSSSCSAWRRATRSPRPSAASSARRRSTPRREALGLDRPLIVQYLEYLGQVARLDFGTIDQRQPPDPRHHPRPGRRDADPDRRRLRLRPAHRASPGAARRPLPRHRRSTPASGSSASSATPPRSSGSGSCSCCWSSSSFPGWPTYDIATPITKFTVQPQTHILLVDADPRRRQRGDHRRAQAPRAARASPSGCCCPA